MIAYNGGFEKPELWLDKLTNKKKFFLATSINFCQDFLDDMVEEDIPVKAYITKWRINPELIADPDYLFGFEKFQQELDNHASLELDKSLKDYCNSKEMIGIWMRESQTATICIYPDLLVRKLQCLGYETYIYNFEKNTYEYDSSTNFS